MSNSTYEFIASRLKASPEEIIAAYNGLFANLDELDGEKVAAVLEPLGVGGPKSVLEEMAPYIETVEPRAGESESLASSCSLVLGSLACTGHMEFQEARDMVHEHIDEEALHSIFDSELYRYESFEARDKGAYKLGVTLAKKSINCAYKSGSTSQILMGKYAEALSLFSSGDYALSAKKILMLWKMYEKNSSGKGDKPQLAHIIKKGVLEMWRDSHAKLGNLEEASKVQGILYDLGYKKETAEEWKAWAGVIMSQSVRGGSAAGGI